MNMGTWFYLLCLWGSSLAVMSGGTTEYYKRVITLPNRVFNGVRLYLSLS